MDIDIVGMQHNDTGGFESRGGDAAEPGLGEQRPDLTAQFPLALPQGIESRGFGFLHGLPEHRQGVCGHGGVIGVAAILIGPHNVQPLFQVGGKTAAGGVFDALNSFRSKGDQRGAGGRAPSFLRGTDQHVHAGGGHVHPERPGGHAIQHEQATDATDRVANSLQVVVGQYHARGGFHMGSEDHGGPVGENGGNYLVHWRWRVGGLMIVLHWSCFQYCRVGRDATHIENLAPAVTEPAVADDQTVLSMTELAGHCFHSETAATWHHHGRLTPVGAL